MPLVVFLKGVNVGGYRTVRPSLLASELQKYGVINIGGAGTFVVPKPVSQARMRQELLRCLPFETAVMICPGRELIAAAAANPFDRKPTSPDVVRFVSVLAKRPPIPPSMPIRLPPKGKWLLRFLSTQGRFVFGLYRREMRVISVLGGIDKIFGMPVTTRNWNTIRAVLTILEKEQNS